jgi:hypothetical protein
MIFRRFSTQVRKHNWLAAGMDFLIVVIGVFLGIQASNWNQTRQDRAEEQRYFAQVIGDLRQDLETFETVKIRSANFDRAAEHTLAALQNGISPNENPGRVALDIHLGGFLFVPRPARATYDELISTGNLGLLRDTSAKAALAKYYQQFDENRQWDVLLRDQQSEYWRAAAGILPRRVLQEAIRGREANVTAGEADHIIEAARERPRIKDLLIGMAAHQERVRRDSEFMAERARALIDQLQPLAE